MALGSRTTKLMNTYPQPLWQRTTIAHFSLSLSHSVGNVQLFAFYPSLSLSLAPLVAELFYAAFLGLYVDLSCGAGAVLFCCSSQTKAAARGERKVSALFAVNELAISLLMKEISCYMPRHAYTITKSFKVVCGLRKKMQQVKLLSIFRDTGKAEI